MLVPDSPRPLHTFALAAALALAAAAPLSAAADDEAAAPPSRFKDPDDGRFDLSAFLDTAYGFVPLLVPISDPAVGYGAVGALVFVHGKPPEPGEPYVRPTISTVGAIKTENDTRGWFAANMGTWAGGRVRTLAALADVDVNLEFFGLGGDAGGSDGLGYSVKGHGGTAGASYRLGDTKLWLGMRYLSVDTGVTAAAALLPGVSSADYALDLGALTPTLTFDDRDNFFTPTRGWYLDLSIPVYRRSLGSDRDFETLNLTTLFYHPVGESLHLGVRGSIKHSSDDTPFFLRPYVSLRGVQSLRYQGEQAAEVEAEVRWQLGPRYSIVGFAGTGTARASIATRDRDESVTAGGAGFRYLIARRYGVHLGIDIAAGPDDTVFYVVFGNAWLRP